MDATWLKTTIGVSHVGTKYDMVEQMLEGVYDSPRLQLCSQCIHHGSQEFVPRSPTCAVKNKDAKGFVAGVMVNG
jgi:hypothetical protein